jgi:hypothetical protein
MVCFLTQLFLKKITPRKVRFDTPRGYFFKKHPYKPEYCFGDFKNSLADKN